jgi:hypothetical protein
MKTTEAFAMLFVATLTSVNISTAATTLGSVGDGMPSVEYIAANGEMIIRPDGVPIGVFDFQSANGIFIANAIFPPQGLVPVIDTATQKGWGTLPVNAITVDFSLGLVARSGLSLDYVLEDFSFVGNSGFGTGTLILDLVYTIPEPATMAFWGPGLVALVSFRPRRD